jgi:branched-chain amino acid transport system ATP-binding protein
MVAIADVSLAVDAGEIVTVAGANGAGKSTLLKSIAGMEKPRSGTVTFAGEAIGALPAHLITARGIAYVPENKRLFPRLSVADNLRLGSYLHRRDPDRDSPLEMVFALFPRLKERLAQRASTLSGGEQQMLAIGRALMMQPKILILDEPTLGLAPVILEQLSKALEKLRQTTPITVLLGEQNVTFALPHADRVYVLEHARIVWEGDPGRFAAEAGEGYL